MIFTEKLKENRDYCRLYSRGKTLVDPVLVTYYVRTGNKDERKIGITAAKKVGKAVQRTRARRLIVAAYTVLEPATEGGYRVVFVARAKTAHVKTDRVLAAMKKHLKAAGILHS